MIDQQHSVHLLIQNYMWQSCVEFEDHSILYQKSFNQGASVMKAPFRSETNFSRSNTGALWLHKYFLKGAFYLERFSTPLVQLSRLLVRLLLNNFYFAHNQGCEYYAGIISNIIDPWKHQALCEHNSVIFCPVRIAHAQFSRDLIGKNGRTHRALLQYQQPV